MKTLRNIIGMAAVLAVFAIPGTTIAEVAGSKHDLANASNNIYQTTTDEVCVFCHTPHAGSTNSKPLWNRQETLNTFDMYDSPSMDMVVAAQPLGPSLICLSCHDGTVALDALLNAPNSAPPPPYAFVGTDAGGHLPAGITLVGPDLTNDHPISVTYDTTADPDFVAVPSGVKLVDGRVECSSCHDPHDTTNIPFLRVSNANSALCLACHQL